MKKIWAIILFFVAINVVLAGETDKEVGDLLDKVEAGATKLKTYQAQMKYTLEQRDLDIITIQNGEIFYKATDEGIWARMNFRDMLQLDVEELEEDPKDWAKPVKFNDDYVFDGMWLTRRNERTKMIQKWQVSRTAKDKDAFRLGNGPFPLPFSITKADLLKHFSVKIAKIAEKNDKSTAKELKNTILIELIPLKESAYAREYVKLELWMSSDNFLPVQISYHKNMGSYEVTTVMWMDIKVDDKKGIDNKIFVIDENIGAGWQKEITPLKDGPETKVDNN